MMRLGPGVAIALAVCSGAFGAVDRGLIGLLPPETQLVVNVNAQEARGTNFGQYLLNNTHWNDAKLQQLMTDTGFDPRRDLITLVIAGNRSPQAPDRHENGFVALARGNFDASKVAGLAVKRGATSETVNGTKLYMMKDGEATRGLAFPDSDVAVMGDLRLVRQVLSSHSSPAPLNPQLEQLIDRASNDQELWFASLGLAEGISTAVQPDAPSQHARLLQSIVSSTGGVRFGSDVKFSFQASARSAKDAQSLADVVRFLASAAQLKRDQDPNATALGPALDRLNLSTEGNELRMSTSLPESELEKLAAQMQHHGRPHSRPIHYQPKEQIK